MLSTGFYGPQTLNTTKTLNTFRGCPSNDYQQRKSLGETPFWICYFLSEVSRIQTDHKIGNYYGIYNEKLQISNLVQVTQIIRGQDDLPIQAQSETGELLWYPDDWLIPCECEAFQLTEPLSEEKILPYVFINDKPIQKSKTSDIYNSKLRSNKISQKALDNAERFDWDLKVMFQTLKKLKIPTKIKNTWFQILHNSIKVMTNIHYADHEPKCPLCKQEDEDIEHLLSKCSITKFLQLPNWNSWPKNKTELTVLLTTHYFIWKTRCDIVFNQTPVDQIAKKTQLKKILKETKSILLQNPEILED